MKVLKYNKIFFTALGMYSFKRIKKPFDKLVQALSFCLFPTVLGVSVTSSCAYLYQNFSNIQQLPDMIGAFLPIVGCLGQLGSYLSFVKNKKKLEDLEDELQEIVDKGEK